MTSTTRKPFACSSCPKQYGRAEHLKRHEARHNGASPYTCATCNKSFSRKDALVRHHEVHGSGASLLERKGRACLGCAQSKSKCTGTKPCARCSKKNIDCSFPDKQLGENRLQHGELVMDLEGGLEMGATALPSVDRNMMIEDSGTAIALPDPSPDDMNGFDAGYWSPNMLSSINWLPIDLPTLPMNDDLILPALFDDYPGTLDNAMAGGYEFEQHSTPTFEEALASPVTHVSKGDSNYSSAPSHRTGDLYIDSDAARLPRIKRRKVIHQQGEAVVVPSPTFDYDVDLAVLLRFPTYTTLPGALYSALCHSFNSNCVSCTQPLVPFASAKFPSKETFEALIALFFHEVQPTLPCFHLSTFERRLKRNNLETQLLLVAMAAIGAPFLDGPNSALCASSMLEFGRRLLLQIRSLDITTQSTEFAQAQLLLVTGSRVDLFGHKTSWIEHCMQDLRTFCLSFARSHCEKPSSLKSAGEAEYRRLIEEEETLRTTYCIWQIDLLEYARGEAERPFLPLSAIAGLPLPHTKLWLALDAQTWETSSKDTATMTLFEALRCLYMEKRLPESLNDLDHIVTLYAVIHRTWEVENDVSHPFSSMEPSSIREEDHSMGQTMQWPPGVPHFARWRNSACDCFDILHWKANAAIGNAKGLEPPKVLHLHLARLLILVPLASILKLSRRKSTLGSTGNSIGSAAVNEAQRIVYNWVYSDQYKARLSAIHAGVIFWHVRRYSINGFYEPFAVLAATITLWALSFFTKNSDSDTDDDQSSANSRCEIILIDRPTDDELVQQFVRSGDKMKVHLSSVSNLWDNDAPPKILREGKKLLSSLGAWIRESRSAMEIIDGLPKHSS